MVKLGDELQILKKYIDIQNNRFNGKITLHLDIHDELYNIRILRMILQPVVENSVVHGLSALKENGRIEITGRETGGDIYIYVTDNGKGIESDRLNEINAQLDKEIDYGQLEYRERIGIFNVNARIKLLFGNMYGLRLFPGPDGGNRTRIILPISTDVRENND